jgi:hypothetical protein
MKTHLIIYFFLLTAICSNAQNIKQDIERQKQQKNTEIHSNSETERLRKLSGKYIYKGRICDNCVDLEILETLILDADGNAKYYPCYDDCGCWGIYFVSDNTLTFFGY